MVRRIVLILALSLALALLLLGMATHGAWTSEQAYLPPVLPVESGTLPAPPKPPDSLDSSPDMERVWAAAAAEDSSPDLATGAKTGTFGGRIALTFDDGPRARTTPEVLDTLKKYDLKATFFVLGRQVKKNPDLVRRIVKEGHTLGNHTYDHADLSALSANQMRRELQSTQKAVDDALGYHYPMMIMRPPYGDPYIEGSNALPVFRRVVREQKLIPVMWTVDPSDYLHGGDPRGLIRAIVRTDKAKHKEQQRKRDEVVLLHDSHGQTARALPDIIDYYQRTGRDFTDVDELLADRYLDP
ncbi:hypothetical protein BH18ACT10_BH18ACT10_18990 [soil metagenome]